MLLKLLKHFKSDIQGIGMFSLGIGMGHGLDNEYVRIALWVGLIALTINLFVEFVELKK